MYRHYISRFSTYATSTLEKVSWRQSKYGSIVSNVPLQITVGVLCASYWRGAWYIFDATLFPDDQKVSAASSLLLGSALLTAKQYMLSPINNCSRILTRAFPPAKKYSLRIYYVKINRFVSLYSIGIACVLVWRGAWLTWDEFAHFKTNHHTINEDNDLKQEVDATMEEKERENRATLYSGIASHLFGTVCLLFLGRFQSIMAPPANISMTKDLFLHGKGKQYSKALKTFL